jgi:hypothetical protein
LGAGIGEPSWGLTGTSTELTEHEPQAKKVIVNAIEIDFCRVLWILILSSWFSLSSISISKKINSSINQ